MSNQLPKAHQTQHDDKNSKTGSSQQSRKQQAHSHAKQTHQEGGADESPKGRAGERTHNADKPGHDKSKSSNK